MQLGLSCSEARVGSTNKALVSKVRWVQEPCGWHRIKFPHVLPNSRNLWQQCWLPFRTHWISVFSSILHGRCSDSPGLENSIKQANNYTSSSSTKYVNTAVNLIMKTPLSKSVWLVSTSYDVTMLWLSFDFRHNRTLKSSRLSIWASEISSLITVFLSEQLCFHAVLANKGSAFFPCSSHLLWHISTKTLFFSEC